MKVYIAGQLWEKNQRAKLERIDKICKEFGFETFLPHRDVGVYEKGDSKPFFLEDSKVIDECGLMIAWLDWKGIGSGTAWEIGYAYAKEIPVIGIIEDRESISEFDRVCVMVLNSVHLVDSLDELEKELVKRFG